MITIFFDICLPFTLKYNREWPEIKYYIYLNISKPQTNFKLIIIEGYQLTTLAGNIFVGQTELTSLSLDTNPLTT